MEWIKVTDRVPSKKGEYLVKGKIRTTHGMWMSQFNGEKFHGFKRRKVQHWAEIIKKNDNNQNDIYDLSGMD